MALKIPLRKINLGQKIISFMGPSIWNKLSNDLKFLKITTSFTHNYNNLILKNLSNYVIILIINYIIIAIIIIIFIKSFEDR